MSDEILCEVRLQLTSVQAEMLMQMIHIGLSGRVNAGWRKPEEWVTLTAAVTEALSFARGKAVK